VRLLGRKREEGRSVNGTTSQVVPKGTIRAVIRKHRHQLEVVSDAAAREAAHRNAPAPADPPSMPDRWSVERGRRQLADLLSRAERSD
jgi:hypothetical protein